MGMSVKIKLDDKAAKQLDESRKKALLYALNAARDELAAMGVMPFETGDMQDRSTYVDDSELSKGRAFLVTNAEYAKQLYFNPAYRFKGTVNKNAGAYWFEPFLTGLHKDFLQKKYAECLKELIEHQ